MRKVKNVLYTMAMVTGLVSACVLFNSNHVWLGLGVLFLMALATSVKVQSKPTGEG